MTGTPHLQGQATMAEVVAAQERLLEAARGLRQVGPVWVKTLAEAPQIADDIETIIQALAMSRCHALSLERVVHDGSKMIGEALKEALAALKARKG